MSHEMVYLKEIVHMDDELFIGRTLSSSFSSLFC